MKTRRGASGNEKYCRKRFLLCSPGSATATIKTFYIHGTKWGNKTQNSFFVAISQEENSRIGRNMGLKFVT
jgi:hypothetical protein